MSDNGQTATPMLETLLERISTLTTEFQSFRGAVEQRLTQIQDEMNKGFADIRNEMTRGSAEIRDEMNLGFRNVERRLDVVSGDINKLRADLRYLEDRIEKLEHQPS